MIIGAGRVITRSGDVAPGFVAVEGAHIVEVGGGIPGRADRVHPRGTLVPGFIDLQVNGGAGVDLLECGPEGVEQLSAHLASTGTTGFLPTLITAPPEQVSGAVQVLRRARPAGAAVLGVHLEGPALSPARRGAHDPAFLVSPREPRLRDLYAGALPELRLVTLASELEGADALITWLAGQGVVLALGHTDATYAQAGQALRRGVVMVTHLYNGMRGLHHREPGVVGAAFDDPQCVCGLIADGVHVHPAAVRLAYRQLGADRIAVVTDAVSAAGAPPGEYRVGGRAFHAREGDAPRLPDGTLAGSVLRMDDAVRNLVAWGIPLRDAVRSASTVPAGILGLVDRGMVAAMMRADLCVLGDDGRAALTIVGGQIVYERETG